MAIAYRIVAVLTIYFVLELHSGVDAYSYVGCFKDAGDDEERALPEVGKYIPGITIAKCHNFCTEEGFVYFGVERDFCFCGAWDTDYAKYGALEDVSCNTPCWGDATQMCGNYGALRVFVDDIPECDDIALEHGQVNRLGLSATFLCNKGYYLQGNTQIDCIYDDFVESFHWDRSPPICTLDAVTQPPKHMTTMIKVTPTTYRTTQTTTKYHTTNKPSPFQSSVPNHYTLYPTDSNDLTTTNVRKSQPSNQHTTEPKKDRETQGKDKIIGKPPQDKQKSENGANLTSQYSLALIVISTMGLIVGVI